MAELNCLFLRLSVEVSNFVSLSTTTRLFVSLTTLFFACLSLFIHQIFGYLAIGLPIGQPSSDLDLAIYLRR